MEQRFQREMDFFLDASRENIYRMIKKTPPGKVRDILVVCCKRKDGKGMRSIARELMKPHSTIHGILLGPATSGKIQEAF